MPVTLSDPEAVTSSDLEEHEELEAGRRGNERDPLPRKVSVRRRVVVDDVLE